MFQGVNDEGRCHALVVFAYDAKTPTAGRIRPDPEPKVPGDVALVEENVDDRRRISAADEAADHGSDVLHQVDLPRRNSFTVSGYV